MATYLQVLDAPFVSRSLTRYVFQYPHGRLLISVNFYISFEFTRNDQGRIYVDYARDDTPVEFQPVFEGGGNYTEQPRIEDILKTSDEQAARGLMMAEVKDIGHLKIALFGGGSPMTFRLDQPVDFQPFQGIRILW